MVKVIGNGSSEKWSMVAPDGQNRCSSRPTSDAIDALELLIDEDENSDFEDVSYPPPSKFTLSPTDEAKTFTSPAVPSLSLDDVNAFFDMDGRIVEEHRFRKAIFKSGICPEARPIAWPFLFDLYPFTSTKRERELMRAEYHLKYNAIKHCWQTHLIEKFSDSAERNKCIAPSYLELVPTSPEPEEEEEEGKDSPDFAAAQQDQSLKLQSQVFAGRLKLDHKSLTEAIHIIDKDVPRTDRSQPYFSGDTFHLRMLRNTLITYATVHPDLGYTQGMNDIQSRFLTVFDDEVEAYWCLEKYMEHAKQDFMANGLLNKLKLVRQLIQEVDQELFSYLEFLQMADMTFCHRWMLLSFKREFYWEDSMRCFEILYSKHLELTSHEAMKKKQKEMRREFEKQGGNCGATETCEGAEFTFEVFMCVTILKQCRGQIFQCREACELFELICKKSHNINLDTLLRDSEVLFYKYCQKTVDDGFEVLDVPKATASPSKNAKMVVPS